MHGASGANHCLWCESMANDKNKFVNVFAIKATSTTVLSSNDPNECIDRDGRESNSS